MVADTGDLVRWLQGVENASRCTRPRMRIIEEGLTYLASTVLRSRTGRGSQERPRAGIEQIGTTHDNVVRRITAIRQGEKLCQSPSGRTGWGTVIDGGVILFEITGG